MGEYVHDPHPPPLRGLVTGAESATLAEHPDVRSGLMHSLVHPAVPHID